MKHLSEQEKLFIIQHVALGENFTSIGYQIGKSRQSVSKFYKLFEKTNSIKIKEGQGRKPVTTPEDDKYIDKLVKRNRFITANEIKALAPFKKLSISTIKRRIKKTKLAI